MCTRRISTLFIDRTFQRRQLYVKILLNKHVSREFPNGIVWLKNSLDYEQASFNFICFIIHLRAPKVQAYKLQFNSKYIILLKLNEAPLFGFAINKNTFDRQRYYQFLGSFSLPNINYYPPLKKKENENRPYIEMVIVQVMGIVANVT